MGSPGTPTLEPVDPADLERLRPLWLHLHAHHQHVGPELGPYRPDGESWSARRALYAACLDGGGFGFVAVCDGLDAGYVLVAVHADDPLWADTWVVGRLVAEIETVLVIPELRGRGLGGLLLDAADAELERRGIPDSAIGVLPQNAAAVRLYERRGYRPAWLVLTRFRSPGTEEPAARSA